MKTKELKSCEDLQKEYDAKLAELDRLITENNAKLAMRHLAMEAAIADAQDAISTVIEKLKGENRFALSDIPNVDGFRFIGITKDGKEIACYVMYNEIGNYDCHDEQTGLPCFHRLAYWRAI